MKNFFKDFFGRSFISFVIIGVVNTVLSLFIQFALYAIFPKQLDLSFVSIPLFAYWASTSIAFILCSISSFYFNRKYSFKSSANVLKSAIKFAINIAVCYLIAYSVAQPLANLFVIKTNINLFNATSDQIAMVFGQITFTMLNYVGQKFFTFKD